MALLQRATTEQPVPLSITLYPQDSETPTDADTNSVSVTVDHVNGTQLLAPTAPGHATAGVYTATLPPQSNPANAIVTWSYTVGGVACTAVRYLTVVQTHYVELPEIRALDGLNDTTAYPTALLVEKRDQAETLFEQATGIFWTPHFVRDVLDGDPNYRVTLQSAIRDVIDYIPMKRLVLRESFPRQLIGVSFIDPNTGYLAPFGQSQTTLAASYAVGQASMQVANTQQVAPTSAQPNGQPPFPQQGYVQVAGVLNPIAYTSTDATHFYGCTGGTNGSANIGAAVAAPISSYYLVYNSGELEAQLGVAAFPRGMENVVVDYYAGLNGMPSDLTLALKTYIRYLVLHTNARIPDRATSMTTEFGTFRIGSPKDWENPTGLPEVDAVLRRRGERVPTFA